MDELNRDGADSLPYPLQRELVRHLTVAAEAARRSDLMPLWAGQSAGLSACTDVVSFLTSLVESVEDMSCPILEWDHATSSAALTTILAER
jgi:nitronate monooxygenase